MEKKIQLQSICFWEFLSSPDNCEKDTGELVWEEEVE